MGTESRLKYHVFDSWEGHTFEAYSNACSKCATNFRDWVRTQNQCAGETREIKVELGGERE